MASFASRPSDASSYTRAAATVATGSARDSVVRFFTGVNELSAIVIAWLMRLAPIGVFVLIAVTVARSGMALLTQLATFTVVVVLALIVHVILVLLPVLRAGARMSIRHFFSSVSDALLLAFSTASSNRASITAVQFEVSIRVQ